MVSYAARATSDALEVISWLLPLQSRCHVTFNRAWRQLFPFETSIVIALVSGQENVRPQSHRFLFCFVDVFVIFPPKTYVIFSVVCLQTVFACFCSVKNFAIRAFFFALLSVAQRESFIQYYKRTLCVSEKILWRFPPLYCLIPQRYAGENVKF